tara:strand:+ start:1371 stop:1616 length:246 start_codon:yes stop_codon:yes gene_type:complete
MKILIWVHKNDIMANKILTYHFTRPIIDRHDEYVQIEISQDEFVQLEDAKYTKRDENAFLVSQYNRNREAKDHITDASQIK